MNCLFPLFHLNFNAKINLSQKLMLYVILIIVTVIIRLSKVKQNHTPLSLSYVIHQMQ